MQPDNAGKLEKSRQTFLRALFMGKREMTPHEARVRADILGLEWLKPPLVIAAIAPFYTDVPLEEKDELILNYEAFIAQQLERAGYRGICLTDSCERFIVMLSLHEGYTRPDDLDEYFISVHEQLYQRFGKEQFIGIGSVVDELNKVDTSFTDAIEMLAYKFQYSSRGVINISNLMRFEHARYVNNHIAVERVIGCFQDGDLGKMSLRLDELIEQVRYRPGVSKTSIRRTMIELLINVLNISSNAGVDVDECLEGRDPYRWILDQGRTEIITEWFMQVCSRLLVKINATKQSQEQHTIHMACEYVAQNLHSNALSLQTVSAHVGLSAPYFSQLFKREMGDGLNAYITQRRVECARELLVTTNLKNEEIALQTGFSSVSYFSTVFRNKMGQSPAEYRKKMTEAAGNA